MRIIFKILAAPFVLVLTLLVAVLSFLLSLSAGLLSILASVLGLLSVLMLFVEKDISTGIAGLLMAFAISPFGLPALAGWLLAKLDELSGCDLHSSVILGTVDDSVFKRLGINVTCEATYEDNNLYHK